MSENMEKIRSIKSTNERGWMALPGVVAVGIGLVSGGKPGIVVSVANNLNEIRSKIPTVVEGIPVEVQETGEIRAL